MTELSPPRDTIAARRRSDLAEFISARRGLIADYASAISGSAGRLVFSLVYFVALANTLPVADFGLFATAAAVGLVLSRLLAFGFVSPLYRIATVRPRLLGTFMAGFLALSAISLPLIAAAGAAIYLLFFSGEMAAAAFAGVIVAEALLWRPAEALVIVANGLGRFGRGALIVILGTALKAAAAISLAFWPGAGLEEWVTLYLAANAVSLLAAILWLAPRQTMRLKWRLYARRLPDSIYVGSAEIMFYVQGELDKLLVLAIGGPRLAGFYAIIMRLVDLTAIPIRTFSMLLVQRLMRAPETLDSVRLRAAIETGIAIVSTLAMATLALILSFFPTLLGTNVAKVAPAIGLALFVPGLRNLIEYHAELLFARGQTLVRALNLAMLAAAKAVLLTMVLRQTPDVADMTLMLNGMFAALYAASALLTYSALRMPAKKI